MQDQDKFSFINEKRKEKPVNKKRLLIQAVFIIAMAVVFGLVSSLVFAYFQPKFQQMLYPEEDTVITLPKDEIQTAQETEETETQEPEEDDAQAPDVPEPRELEIEDYQRLQNKIYAVGREASRFVVTVTGVKRDTDWFNNDYESKGHSYGIIFENDGKELLILTERKAIADVQEIYVTFANDVSVEASMKKYDGNTGITVLSVLLSEVDEGTMNSIKVATLGNSTVTAQGEIAIAVGGMTGTGMFILTGNVTSTANEITSTDHNFSVLTTNITGNQNGSGAIVNANGEVIGLMVQGYGSMADQGTVTAFAISDVKAIIEKLANNQDIPYIGLELTTVTSDIEREYGIPKGAYIKGVKMDSPAMAAGLQTGDVVTAIGGETILSVEAPKITFVFFVFTLTEILVMPFIRLNLPIRFSCARSFVPLMTMHTMISPVVNPYRIST